MWQPATGRHIVTDLPESAVCVHKPCTCLEQPYQSSRGTLDGLVEEGENNMKKEVFNLERIVFKRPLKE